MIDPNEYVVEELEAVVNGARKKFAEMLSKDANYFGNDKGTEERIKATLNETAPKVQLGVRDTIDANSAAGIMKTVDLTILDLKASDERVEKVARRAACESTATVCVYPQHVHIVKRVMEAKGITDVPPIAVVGFPSVSVPSPEETAKTVGQTVEAIKEGALEIDMVLPTSFREIGSGSNNESVYRQHFGYIKAIVDEAHKSNVPVKVILETAYLNDRQIAEACILAKIAGADWVKTSTGFAEADKFAAGKNIDQHKGATPHDVALMRLTVGDFSLDDNGNIKPMGVKASGGVRNHAQAIAVLKAGADRIGASDGINVGQDGDANAPAANGSKY